MRRSLVVVVLAVVLVAAGIAVAQPAGQYATVTGADGASGEFLLPITIDYPTTTTQATTTTTTQAPTTTTQATTTTVPPTTSTTMSPSGTVGFLGCSMTKNGIQGYTGDRFWYDQGARYGGMTVDRWRNEIGTSSDQWSAWGSFAYKQNNDPAVAVWFQFCTMGSGAYSFNAAVAVVNEIKRLVPGAVVYVSAQPLYTGGHVCSIAGSGLGGLAALVDDVVAAGVALRGPLQGPLSGSDTSDGCHANGAGKAILGGQLVDFFG